MNTKLLCLLLSDISTVLKSHTVLELEETLVVTSLIPCTGMGRTSPINPGVETYLYSQELQLQTVAK